jgi:ABC-type sulfate transport system permease subunit
LRASYENFDQTAAYAASVLLAAIAIVTLVLMTMLRPREEVHGNRGA